MVKRSGVAYSCSYALLPTVKRSGVEYSCSYALLIKMHAAPRLPRWLVGQRDGTVYSDRE